MNTVCSVYCCADSGWIKLLRLLMFTGEQDKEGDGSHQAVYTSLFNVMMTNDGKWHAHLCASLQF